MTSWKRGGQTGLFHYRLSLERDADACPPESEGRKRESLDVMAKVKPPDEDSIEVAETAAAIVDTDLRRHMTRFRDRLGMRGAQFREPEIYRLHTDDAIGRHCRAAMGRGWTKISRSGDCCLNTSATWR